MRRLMSILGESYEFYKTSQNNELAEEISVGFDYTISSFCSEVFHILFLEKFC